MRYLFFATVLLFMLSACDENTTDVQDTEKEEETEEEYLTEIHLYQEGYPPCDTTRFYPDSFRYKLKKYCSDDKILLDSVLTYEEMESYYGDHELKTTDINFQSISANANLDSIFLLDSLPYVKFDKPTAREVKVYLKFITNKRSKTIYLKWYRENLIPHIDSVYRNIRDYRTYLSDWISKEIGE